MQDRCTRTLIGYRPDGYVTTYQENLAQKPGVLYRWENSHPGRLIPGYQGLPFVAQQVPKGGTQSIRVVKNGHSQHAGVGD